MGPYRRGLPAYYRKRALQSEARQTRRWLSQDETIVGGQEDRGAVGIYKRKDATPPGKFDASDVQSHGAPTTRQVGRSGGGSSGVQGGIAQFARHRGKFDKLNRRVACQVGLTT